MSETNTERERLAQISRVKGEISDLEDRLDEKRSVLAELIRAGLEVEARTFAAALPTETVQEIVALAKIPGIKRLKELTSCDLRTAVHVYDLLRDEYA